MIPQLPTQLTALEAQATANGFLLDNLPDHYLTVEPRLDSSTKTWRLPVVISYPFIGPIGEVGEIHVSSSREEVVSHTPLEEIRTRARALYEQHREAIQAAFHQGINF